MKTKKETKLSLMRMMTNSRMMKGMMTKKSLMLMMMKMTKKMMKRKMTPKRSPRENKKYDYFLKLHIMHNL